MPISPTRSNPMRLPRQQKMIDRGEVVPVLAVPGRTVRGTTYFKEVELLVSPEFAEHLIAQGDVKEASAVWTAEAENDRQDAPRP
jgi:hypothetical protein